MTQSRSEKLTRRAILFVAVVAVLGLAGLVLNRIISFDELVRYEQQLRRLVGNHPVASFAAGLLIYVAASLVPGTTGKALLFGWLFGFWPGLVLVNCGLTTAAVIAFLISRRLCCEAVHARWGPTVSRIDAALLREGPFYLLMLRLLHAPYTLTNYAAGATAVRLRTFWWTTQLGLIPGNVAFVLAGARVPSLGDLAQSPWDLVNVPLLLALSATVLLPVAVRRAVRWRRSDAGVDRDANSTPRLPGVGAR